jgi:hypothetical protein
MTEPRFTPGPWFIESDPPCNDHWYPGLTIGSEPEGTRICDLTPLRDKSGNAANVRLIAAAPDLYAQLEDARVTLGEAAKILAGSRPSFANNIVNQCGIRCGDVLAKARGESA